MSLPDVELTAEAVFAYMKRDEENLRCVDCGTLSPQWASVSHGILMCLVCSGVHRSLGVHISFVRSVTMDSWNPKQLKMMLAGGNAAMKKYFKSIDMPSGSSIEFKYKTKGAESYRHYVRALSEGRELPALLYAGALDCTEFKSSNNFTSNVSNGSNGNSNGGVQYITSDSPNTVRQSYQGFGSGGYQSSPSNRTDAGSTDIDAAFSALSSAFSKGFTMAKSAAVTVAQKVQDPALMDKLKQAGKTVAESTKHTAQKIKEDPLTQKVADSTKQGWTSFTALIKKGIDSTVNIIEGNQPTNNRGEQVANKLSKLSTGRMQGFGSGSYQPPTGPSAPSSSQYDSTDVPASYGSRSTVTSYQNSQSVAREDENNFYQSGSSSYQSSDPSLYPTLNEARSSPSAPSASDWDQSWDDGWDSKPTAPAAVSKPSTVPVASAAAVVPTVPKATTNSTAASSSNWDWDDDWNK